MRQHGYSIGFIFIEPIHSHVIAQKCAFRCLALYNYVSQTGEALLPWGQYAGVTFNSIFLCNKYTLVQVNDRRQSAKLFRFLSLSLSPSFH